MNIHVLSVHMKQKQFNCGICDYGCNVKGDMTKHVVSVHEEKKIADEKQEMIHCQICDYNCKKTAMKSHIRRVHEKERNFKCGICDYSSFRSSDLKKHTLSVHDELFKCEICEYSSSFKHNIKNTLLQFTRRRKTLNVIYVTTAVFLKIV